jgi:putative glutamine amidotransferase
LVRYILNTYQLDGVILTGGNDLLLYGGNAPERDETEGLVIQYSIKNQIPLLGVCRGMQIIAHYFEMELKKVEDHVAKNHIIHYLGNEEIVNSYHNYAIKNVIPDFSILAKSEDGQIEAIKHKKHSIYGIMWHPERNATYAEMDIQIIKEVFN